MERLPVISITERQRLGEPSWDHTSKAISKKIKGNKKGNEKIKTFSKEKRM